MISSREKQHQARQQLEHAEALKRKAERREAHERRMRRQAEEAARAKLERARRHKLHKEQEEKYRREKEQRRSWGSSAQSEFNFNQNAYTSSSSSSGPDWSGMLEREAVARYEAGWERMRQVSAAGQALRFSDIPWPTLQPISSPQDLSRRSIESFIFSDSYCQRQDRRTRLRAFILQWHPDKFIGRWISDVFEQDENAVREGVTLVTCIANELLATCGK
ncbi:hypothetical protein BDV93DRAFT_520393 [Ceratobasidium sp. AG-I]|nr:hypothetical protein BDV93DRAFT_520393 [Ceratobasidium sp. AG-I]